MFLRLKVVGQTGRVMGESAIDFRVFAFIQTDATGLWTSSAMVIIADAGRWMSEATICICIILASRTCVDLQAFAGLPQHSCKDSLLVVR